MATIIPNIVTWSIVPQKGTVTFYDDMNVWLGETNTVVDSWNTALNATNAVNQEINVIYNQIQNADPTSGYSQAYINRALASPYSEYKALGGENSVVTLDNTNLIVYKNNTLLEEITDYTLNVDGLTVNLVTPLNLDDLVQWYDFNKLDQKYTKKIDTMAKFRLLSIPFPRVWLSGYHTKNDGAFGDTFYRLKGLKTSEVDNGGTIIVTNIASTEYVYELQYSGEIYAEWFGAVGDDIVDDTVALNNAGGTGEAIQLEPKVYKCTDTVTLDCNTNGNGAVLKFYGTTIDNLLTKNTEANYKNISIDGSNVTNCKHGIFSDASLYEPDNEIYENIIVKNLQHASDSCMGIVLFRSGGSGSIYGKFNINNCRVENISGSSTAKGIHVSFSNNSFSNVFIDKCHIEEISPVADGDGIHILTEAYDNINVSDHLYTATISNCFVKSSVAMKRGIKIQWHNTKVNNCTVIGDNISIGYDTLAPGASFESCTYIQNTSGSEAFNINSSDCFMDNIKIDMQSATQAIRAVDSLNLKISNLELNYRGLANGDTVGIIQINGDSSAHITNSNIVQDQLAGSGILLSGTSTLDISNTTLKGAKFGIRANFGSGYLKASKCNILGTTNGYQVFGTNGFTADFYLCEVECTGQGIYSFSTGNYSKIFVDSCKISAQGNGILGDADDVIQDCDIVNTGSTSGVGILGKSRFKVSNNVITNFSTGIQYTNSTDTIINNNVTIDCTTEINKTGSTDFVFINNFSR